MAKTRWGGQRRQKARNKALPLKEAQNELHQKQREIEDKSPRQTPSEIDIRGIPQVLTAARAEPLNHPLTVKLPESVAKYIIEGPGATFVRAAIIEKLRRLADKPTPAVCSQCVNLKTSRKEGPFCLALVAFLDRKLLNQVFNCDHFQPRKEQR